MSLRSAPAARSVFGALASSLAVPFAFAVSLSLAAGNAAAEVPAAAKAEIDHLLNYVYVSGCEFFRNGSWHDSKRGAAHIADKYNYLLGKDQIRTAGDFIDKAATQSSLTSLSYKVRCQGGAEVASAKWLGEELARLRAASVAGTPGSSGTKPPAAATPAKVAVQLTKG